MNNITNNDSNHGSNLDVGRYISNILIQYQYTQNGVDLDLC